METTTAVKKKGLFITNAGQNVAFTFILVTSLFLLWGFCNGLIDSMDKHFQNELHLTKSQSASVQFAHYLGYFLMSIPAGWLATKLGYKGGIIMGLLIVGLGGLWFLPATHISEIARTGGVSETTAFVAFLAGVCLIATGLTFLETIANPYTTVLGDPHYSATRINLAQSTNGIGFILGPIAGSLFFYGGNGNQTLYIPYLGIAAVVFALAAVFYFAPVPDIKMEDDYHLDDPTPTASHSIWSQRHFVFAVAAQFFYVAAQAGIFSFFINYMTTELPSIPVSWSESSTKFSWMSGWIIASSNGGLSLSDKGASSLASLAFGCFLVGRFTGAGLLRKYSAHKVLGIYAALNVIATFIVFCKFGWVSAFCVFVSFFLMSIMFPTIFALGIFGLGARAKRASSYIVMAIMGGALLPKVMGYVADKFDMSRGFIVPMFCFVLVALYGFAWPKLSKAESLRSVEIGAGH
jgi:FHS family L-fucose permease-like MFS transporter